MKPKGKERKNPESIIISHSFPMFINSPHAEITGQIIQAVLEEGLEEATADAMVSEDATSEAVGTDEATALDALGTDETIPDWLGNDDTIPD